MAQAYLQPGALSCLFRGGFVVLCEAQASWGLGSGEMLRGECATGEDTASAESRGNVVHSLHRSQTQWSGVGRGAEPEIRALVFQQQPRIV